MSSIGQNIKNRRMELGLSVDKLAELLKKSRATIYRYESSDADNMPLSILKPLASALATTPASLMGWTEDSTGTTDAITSLSTQTAHLLKQTPQIVQSEIISKLENVRHTFISNIRHILLHKDDSIFDKIYSLEYFTPTDIKHILKADIDRLSFKLDDKLLSTISSITGYTVLELVFFDIAAIEEERDANELDYDIQQLVDMCKQLPPNVLNHVLEFTEERFRENIGPAPNDL